VKFTRKRTLKLGLLIIFSSLLVPHILPWVGVTVPRISDHIPGGCTEYEFRVTWDNSFFLNTFPDSEIIETPPTQIVIYRALFKYGCTQAGTDCNKYWAIMYTFTLTKINDFEYETSGKISKFQLGFLAAATGLNQDHYNDDNNNVIVPLRFAENNRIFVYHLKR
jgi:hypothetical protein